MSLGQVVVQDNCSLVSWYSPSTEDLGSTADVMVTVITVAISHVVLACQLFSAVDGGETELWCNVQGTIGYPTWCQGD